MLASAHHVVWANEKKARLPDKQNSSIIIHLSDPLQANIAISRGVVYEGTFHLTKKSRCTLTQCHKCQRPGHTAARCRVSVACPRCLGPHPLSSCNCPNSPPCSDLETCTHIQAKCTLCKGEHMATCPVIAGAAEHLAAHNSPINLFFPTHV